MTEDNKKILLLEQEFKDYKNSTEKELTQLRKVVDDQEKRIQQIERTREKTEYQYEQIMETLNKLNNITIPNLTAQVEELKNKPVKRYEQAIGGILGAIFGAVGGSIASIFLK